MYFLRREIRNYEKTRDGIVNTIIVEHTDQGDVFTDIFTKLSNDRILFINDHVDSDVATEISATILLKDMESSDEKISLFINAERGDTRAVLMIYDTMQMVASPIETICCGSAMNEVVLLLAAGTKGMRFATEHTIISPSQLMHNESYVSDLTDAKSTIERSVKDNKNFMRAFAKATGNKLSKVMKDFERKKFFTAKQAKTYGVIDAVIEQHKP